MKQENNLQVLLASCGSWYLPHTADSFLKRQSLAGLWTTDRIHNPDLHSHWERCRPFHAAMMPFYKMAPQIVVERAFYTLFPIWNSWLARRRWPKCHVVHGIMGYCTELFDHAEKSGALKVVDCPNSHPTSYYGYWQRECDLWCPGEKVPIPQWMFARMNRELERADLILCPSLFVKDTMIQNGIPEEKCFVTPFGVNTDIFQPRSVTPQMPKFVAVGTICLRKGHQYLFRAFEIVKQKLPHAELVVVGDYKTDFRMELPRWQGKFTHYPHLSHGELAKLLQTCTAFVFPSQEEGFARVITEAMGAGLPIIASYESGATTLVNDQVEGLIIRGRDPEHIAEAMIRVAEDREMNERMGNAAYQKGAASNTWQDYGDRLLTEYQKRRMDSRR